MVDPRFDYMAALKDCAQGDPLALQRLYEQEAPCMLALANIMLGDQSTAQHAVHDAFVLIWKNAGSYDPATGSARAWMHSIMRYRTASLLRQRPVTPTGATGVSFPPLRPKVSDSPAGVLASQPEQLRTPVLMAFYNGLSYSRIATHRGQSVNELRNNVHASLRALKEADPA